MLNVAPCHDPEYALREVTRDASEYYLREGEAPGRWWGDGATALGLAGDVDATALRDLFAGKHPDTGEYLISARGSSARAIARSNDDDMDTAAAAARLGLSVEGVRTRLRAGTLAGEKTPDGRWRIPATSVEASLGGRPMSAGRGDLPAPAADGTYSLSEAARLAGVNVSYLKRLALRGVPAHPLHEDGRAVQYLAGRRDDRNRWRVAAPELERFMADRSAPRPVPAYDLVMRAPKSVSVLHALGHLVPPADLARMGLPASVAGEVAAAHHAAVADALQLLQRHAALVRSPAGRVVAEGLAVACFDHRSSRTGDPLLHTHAVIANVATGVDGRRAALDGTALYAWASTAGHLYQARLRAELTARLGVRFEQPHNGLADIEGVPREVIDAFSTRRRQIVELMETLGIQRAGAAQVATLATRPPKDDRSHRSPDELADMAARVGFGPRELLGLLGREAPARPTAHQLGEIAAHLAGPEGLCARATLVDLRDAIKGFATEMAAGATGAQLQRWATTLLHDNGRFVPVLARPTRAADVIRRADGRRVRAGGVAQAYATPELLAHEAALLDAHARGLGAAGEGVGLGVATAGSLAAALAARPTLSGEQVAMVSAITTSGIGMELVVGGPGSGKTFALGAAADAWRASGLRVVGAALQGGAAEVLAREAGLDAQFTLTRLLGRCDRHGAGVLSGAVVLVDEAGMADTRQLSRLARYASAAGAKLVLVGDPDQIPEVGAGGAFAHLVAQAEVPVVRLVENRRQRDLAERERLGLIRRGRAEEAIAAARAAGRWTGAPGADALRLRLLEDWAADAGAPGTAKVMVASTVAEVEWLNRAARRILVSEGRLGLDAVTIDLAASDRAVESRELRVGDVVRATRNDAARGIFTGSVGTVVALDASRCEVTVALDASRGPSRTVTLGREYLQERPMPGSRGQIQAPGLAHAYASTAHGVQGRTAERAYVLVTRAGLHRQGIYVAASRAAEATRFYGMGLPEPDDVERIDGGRAAPAPGPDDVAELAEAMKRDATQTMAVVAEPDAAEVGRLMGRRPAWLWAEHAQLAARVGDRPPLAESLRRVRTALASTYGLSLEALECRPLEAAMTRALGVPGVTPEALGDLMARRARAMARELDSAEDPIAVLVWAADAAAGVLARSASEPGDDHGRLALVEAAIARQRLGRLAMAELDARGPLAAVLGPPPPSGAGLTAWRRAAAAVLDYRDAAGIFDRDVPHADAWRRAMGPVPAGEGRAHHDQVLGIVVEARVTIALAALSRHVPPAGARPDVEVEALARRPLRQLDQDLAALRRQCDTATRRASVLRAAQRELERAHQALAELDPPPVGRRRARPADNVAADTRARAEQRVVEAQRRLDTLADTVAATPATGGQEAVVAQAVAVREARLRAQILTEAPPWLRHDLRRRLEAQPCLSSGVVERLARSYGEVAVHADRWGLDAHAPTLDAVVGQDRLPAAAARQWSALASDLRSPAVAPERGMDLSR